MKVVRIIFLSLAVLLGLIALFFLLNLGYAIYINNRNSDNLYFGFMLFTVLTGCSVLVAYLDKL